MGDITEISWTDHTFNPWEGCVKVSPECDNCYAEKRDERWHEGENWGKDASRFPHTDDYWRKPYKWNRDAEKAGVRRRVFCGSLCDIMEDREDVHAHRLRLYPIVEQTPWLDWQFLTKRPQNFRRLLPVHWLTNPLPNVIGMTTVGLSEYLWRAKSLVETPFARRGLSMEPLLGPVDITPFLSAIDWVICGGESGDGVRPMNPDWARSLRDQCKAAGVPFFFKQAGAVLAREWGCKSKAGSIKGEFPQLFQIQEFPQAVQA